MSAGFVHLHVHSQYSLLDGAIRISDLLDKCKEYDMDAVAITDHGTMFGSLEFYVKPGAAREADPALIGESSIPIQLAAIDQPVSVCHQ